MCNKHKQDLAAYFAQGKDTTRRTLMPQDLTGYCNSLQRVQNKKQSLSEVNEHFKATLITPYRATSIEYSIACQQLNGCAATVNAYEDGLHASLNI